MSGLWCLIVGHAYEAREGGKPGAWWARWDECKRCGHVHGYRYVDVGTRMMGMS